MPHIVIRCFQADIPQAGLDRIERTLTRLLEQELACAASAISIDLQQIDPARWGELVYAPLIEPRLDRLLRRPGYTC